tara:strand:+ start:1093 stop:1266 length:174 start_codon:yes stop_codon:yes gene_type:complete
MESPADRIADALERIANILETGAHINIDHGHIEHIDHVDNVDHNHVEGDLNTHAKTW